MASDAVLAFDTSAAHCAAALLSDDRVLHRFEPMERGQAERLMPMLESVLAEAGIGWHDLLAIGVGTGPGNATGVRISVAAARGLALGLGIPAIGVTGLEALAHGLPRPVVAALDARRDQQYIQVFCDPPTLDKTGQPALIGVADPFVVPAGAVFVGHHADQNAARYQGRAGVAACPLAEAIARIARGRVGTRPPRPAPFYLRGADATPPSDPPLVILP